MSIRINIKIGDIILTGKWRNKKTEIKSIDYDSTGIPLVNGKSIVNFKFPKKETKTETIIKLKNLLH